MGNDTDSLNVDDESSVDLCAVDIADDVMTLPVGLNNDSAVLSTYVSNSSMSSSASSGRSPCGEKSKRSSKLTAAITLGCKCESKWPHVILRAKKTLYLLYAEKNCNVTKCSKGPVNDVTMGNKGKYSILFNVTGKKNM